ncbi:MAG: DUF616 domain-containing protein, partial [Desulfovibrio sp.]|nr:DUF616 domain-containing protein [Desulfovibrio sp.]
YARRYKLEKSQAQAHYITVGSREGLAGSFEEEAKRWKEQSRRFLLKQLSAPKRLKEQIERWHGTGERVIFSAVAGNYDSLKIPGFLDPKARYVLFTDKPKHETGVWNILPVPFWHKDPTRITRYVKVHPHYLFPEADVAIWVDQNVLLLGDISEEIEAFLASGAAVGTFFHPTRMTVLEEVYACLKLKKDAVSLMQEQVKRYQKWGLLDLPLANTNVVFYNLKHSKLARFLALWWGELEQYSRRDQLSFPYAVERAQCHWHAIADAGVCAENHPKFGYLPHDHCHGIGQSILQLLTSRQIDPTALGVGEARAAAPRVSICVWCQKTDLLSDVVARCGDEVLFLTRDGQDIPHAHGRFLPEPAPDFATACSLAATYAIHDWLVFLHPAVRITSTNWLDKMMDALTKTTGALLAGPLSNAAGLQTLSLDGTLSPILAEGVDALCERWQEGLSFARVPLLHCFCFVVHKSLCSTLLPHNLGQQACVWALCMLAANAGIDAVLASNTYLYFPPEQDMELSKTLESDRPKLVQQFGFERVQRNERTLLAQPLLVQLRTRLQNVRPEDLAWIV